MSGANRNACLARPPSVGGGGGAFAFGLVGGEQGAGAGRVDRRRPGVPKYPSVARRAGMRSTFPECAARPERRPPSQFRRGATSRRLAAPERLRAGHATRQPPRVTSYPSRGNGTRLLADRAVRTALLPTDSSLLIAARLGCDCLVYIHT